MAADVAVTGASGFIGSVLCTRLTAAGVPVRALVRRLTRCATNGHETTTSSGSTLQYFETGDLHFVKDWTPWLRGVKVVVHLAGLAHRIGESQTSALSEYRRQNCQATVSLAKAMIDNGARRLIFVSSVGVYGPIRGNQPLSADTPTNPLEPYAVSKLEAELALNELARKEQLELVIVRPPIVYGPGNPGNFLRLLKLAHSGFPLPFGSLSEKRSLVYVDNLASLLERCIHDGAAPGRTFLVRDDHDVSLPELITLLRGSMRMPPRLIKCPKTLLIGLGRLTGRTHDIHKLLTAIRVDDQITRTVLKWCPPIPIEEGLAVTGSWYANSV